MICACVRNRRWRSNRCVVFAKCWLGAMHAIVKFLNLQYNAELVKKCFTLFWIFDYSMLINLGFTKFYVSTYFCIILSLVRSNFWLSKVPRSRQTSFFWIMREQLACIFSLSKKKKKLACIYNVSCNKKKKNLLSSFKNFIIIKKIHNL